MTVQRQLEASALTPSGRTLHVLRRKLLRWFDAAKRDLPWRRDRDPYRIWVSEVMLQQTQVATVIPYFERFLDRFPSLAALAAADEHDVLRLWEGLGYYRRARDLHRAARLLVAEHAGELPDDPEVWATLPGVGRYIRGAVLSQAFDRRLPIVEANTRRLYCRLFAQRGDPAATGLQPWLWQTAEALLPRKRAGDFNQALMELGALVCTPAAPGCASCPLARECLANREGTQHLIPDKSPREEARDVREVAVVVRRRGKVLLAQRTAKASRWANMWEFPHVELADGEGHDAAANRLLSMLGLQASIGAELLSLRHAVTRFRIALVCLEANYSGGKFVPGLYAEARWLAPAELCEYPVSAPQRRLAHTVAEPLHQRRLF